jgi:hypothetical protein
VAVVFAARWTVYLDGYLDSTIPEQPLVAVGGADAPAIDRRRNYLAGLEATLCSFARTRPTYVLTPVPEMPAPVPQYLARSELWGRSGTALHVTRADYEARHREVLATLRRASTGCGAVSLEVAEWLCTAGACNAIHDGRPMYYDDHHLSERGNRELLPLFQDVFRSLAGTQTGASASRSGG